MNKPSASSFRFTSKLVQLFTRRRILSLQFQIWILITKFLAINVFLVILYREREKKNNKISYSGMVLLYLKNGCGMWHYISNFWYEKNYVWILNQKCIAVSSLLCRRAKYIEGKQWHNIYMEWMKFCRYAFESQPKELHVGNILSICNDDIKNCAKSC